MDVQELVELAPYIELTTSKDGLGVAEKEFVWIYGRGGLIERLQEHKTMFTLLAGGCEVAVAYEPPINTDAAALIHNHPSRDVSPSYEDIVSFLDCVSNNHELKYNLIVSTENGIVSGYFMMTYVGERSAALTLKAQIELKHDAILNSRRKELRAFPERFDIPWGDNILSMDEEKDMVIDMLCECGFVSTFLPMPGYALNDGRFIEASC